MSRLSTKAETLARIYQKLNNAKVLPQYTFTIGEWKQSQAYVMEAYSSLTWNARVIVRSSSLSEDTQQSSEAGRYESVRVYQTKRHFKRQSKR